MAVITLVEEIRCALHLALVTSTLEVELAWILEERQGAAFSIGQRSSEQMNLPRKWKSTFFCVAASHLK
jgi:hypothetical protein